MGNSNSTHHISNSGPHISKSILSALQPANVSNQFSEETAQENNINLHKIYSALHMQHVLNGGNFNYVNQIETATPNTQRMHVVLPNLEAIQNNRQIQQLYNTNETTSVSTSSQLPVTYNTQSINMNAIIKSISDDNKEDTNPLPSPSNENKEEPKPSPPPSNENKEEPKPSPPPINESTDSKVVQRAKGYEDVRNELFKSLQMVENRYKASAPPSDTYSATSSEYMDSVSQTSDHIVSNNNNVFTSKMATPIANKSLNKKNIFSNVDQFSATSNDNIIDIKANPNPAQFSATSDDTIIDIKANPNPIQFSATSDDTIIDIKANPNPVQFSSTSSEHATETKQNANAKPTSIETTNNKSSNETTLNATNASNNQSTNSFDINKFFETYNDAHATNTNVFLNTSMSDLDSAKQTASSSLSDIIKQVKAPIHNDQISENSSDNTISTIEYIFKLKNKNNKSANNNLLFCSETSYDDTYKF
jgi:hypothetical protein